MPAENVLLESIKSLQPVPVPRGFTSREIVRRAIEFKNPPRIPYLFNYHPTATDIVLVAPVSMAGRKPKRAIGERYTDHWGITWETTGRYWDHAVGHPLADLANLPGYPFPDFSKAIRQVGWFAGLGRRLGKYVMAENPVGMYETMRGLMGFEELMIAPYTQPDGLRALLERLTQLTIDTIEVYSRLGSVDGFETAEDWGLQTSLQMRIDTFREFYKPYYRRIIDACHQRGLHFVWHSCGMIADLFPEMIELGVDVVQMDQPRLMGHERLSTALGSRVCMWNTVDIQWCTTGNISDEEIRKEVGAMLQIYDPAGRGGGYIAKHYPQPWDIGLSIERQMVIYRAFMENGCG